MFPQEFDAVVDLPGIGRSTAAAICVFASGARQPILDGNVKRVLARHLGIAGYPGDKKVQDQLWERAQSLLPIADVEAYTQGLMDLGAGTCTRQPRCGACPVAQDCVAHREGLTAQLPAPRPAKLLPQRETRFAMMLDGAEVLLEKRPAPGIWGGMWCFPEMQAEQLAAHAARFDVELGESTALAAIEHGFTHYRLRIHPVLMRVKRRTLALGEPGVAWISDRCRARVRHSRTGASLTGAVVFDGRYSVQQGRSAAVGTVGLDSPSRPGRIRIGASTSGAPR